MSGKKQLLVGTLILTLSGVAGKFIGFFYRIFLGRTIGAGEMGIYQLTMPVYALALSLGTGGAQMALSRFIAAKTAEKDERSARLFLFFGTFFVLLSSVFISLIFYFGADYIGRVLLGEARTVPLLTIAAWSVVPAGIHNCLCTWHLGRNKTALPSLCLFLEQVVRLLVSYGIYLLHLASGREPTAVIAALGTLAGEIFSCLFAVISAKLTMEPLPGLFSPFPSLSEIMNRYLVPLSSMAVPLTLNRILVNVLHSIESALIPGCLRMSGLSPDAALSQYGILTGMTMPLLLFPSTITHAVSMMLLPDVARDQAAGNQKSICHTTEQTIKYCMILGIFAAGAFFFYGRAMGNAIFGNDTAGVYLTWLAVLSPFLYLEGTLASILNGLGKTGLVFLQSVGGHLLRILFVWFLVPKKGIAGCLLGMVVCEAAAIVLNLFFLSLYLPFSLHPLRDVLLPCASFGAALLFVRAGTILFGAQTVPQSLPGLSVTLGILGILYLAMLLPFLSEHLRQRRNTR